MTVVDRQKTLARSVSFVGVGVHAGMEASVVVRPHHEHGGIVFRRLDLIADPRGARDDAVVIHASAGAVSGTELGTSLANEAGASIATVEHLLAALSIVGVTNAVIDVEGPEIPILDGSAAPFVNAFVDAGLRTQDAPVRRFAPTSAIEVRDGDRFIRAEPGAPRTLETTIAFDDPVIGRQSVIIDLDDLEPAKARLAGARTFCRLSDIEHLRAAGLCQGGSLENAIVVDADGVLNSEGLRDPIEFVLHKALDLVGDLSLTGLRLDARITAMKPGHDLNTRFARRIAELSRVEAEDRERLYA